ncbi:uncharacterized protein [Montipora capricornis]|uniref:uncharacterized protein n=1 Tax=Montipora capricornis TaxID=246305 RepID=UPI0035F1CF7F
MKKSAVSKNGKTYKYILTVQDVFSRYLWLRPLTGKSSKLVARELNKLYTEVGPPRVIQSDNGGEFKQAVDLLCKSLGVKIIRGSPYHPQSQGKVERSHRSLRKKINFDLINFSKVGVNWVSKLMEYQKVLNEELMDVLGKQSPFEVFYGRASNALSEISDGGLSYQESVSSAARISPRASDFRNNGERIRKIRSKARASNNVWDKRYIKRRVKGNPPSVYKVGERVLIRFPFSGRTRGIPKKRFVVDGTIIKRNVQFGKYKITYESPTTEKSCCDWVSVEDMTSATAVEEKRKRAAARRQMSLSKTQKEHKAKKAAHREKYYIAMTPEDLHQPFSEQGFDVTYNPPGDGNCQFSALAHLLQTIGIFHSEESLRREIVRYLAENPNNQDGFPFELFVGMPWSQYLTSIAQNGTYGDQITLQAVANLFNVEIVIISTLGPNAKTVISPQFSIPFASLTLGHFAEDQGIHYVCLTALNHNYGNSSVGDEDICDKPTNEESQWAAHEIGSGENNEEPRSIEDLPNEVLEIIITFSLTGSPRNIVDTFNILSMINKRFRSLTGSFIQRLPRVFFDWDTCVGYHSMRQISKTRGKGSGLVLALKNIINHPQWINAWVRLLYTGIVGWFYIQNIIWKNGRKK